MSEGLESIEVFALGIPKGQPRPRACVRGRRAGVYDPGTAEEWKGAVARAFHGYHGRALDEPVEVRIALLLPRPKGHYGKRGLRGSAPAYHTGKPDVDNAAKAILDAMTDFQFWKDDRCCVCLTVTKEWTAGTPGARIRVGPAAEGAAVAAGEDPLPRGAPYLAPASPRGEGPGR